MNEHRDKQGRFLTGNNGGPGRPPGSRNRLAEEFISDVLAVWTEHGPAVLAQVRDENPLAFAKLVGSLVPARLDVGPVSEFDHLSDEEFYEKLARDMEDTGMPEVAVAFRRNLEKQKHVGTPTRRGQRDGRKN